MPKTENKTAGSFDPAAQTPNRFRSAAKFSSPSPPALRARLLLLDRALQVQRAGREQVGFLLDQEGIEAAAVVDALDRVGRDAQAHVAAEHVRDEGDVAQVRQEPALGLGIRVAHLVAHLRALGRQFTAPRHRAKSSAIPAPATALEGVGHGGPKSCPFREPGTYRGGPAARQGFEAARGRLARAGPVPVPQGLSGAYRPVSHHINGVFGSEILKHAGHIADGWRNYSKAPQSRARFCCQVCFIA